MRQSPVGLDWELLQARHSPARFRPSLAIGIPMNPCGSEGGSGRATERRSGLASPFGIGILILLAVLPYANTLLNGFVYDDNRQVLANPYLKSFRFLPRVFGTTVWSFVGAQGISNYYRPMMTLGYLFCHQLFGPLAYGFHLANLCFHAGVTVLVFAVALKLFRDSAGAVVAACLFAVHPIHTESVAWIAAITDVEVTFFYLLTFYLFLRLPKLGGGRSEWIKLAMILSFGLTILSKEQSLTLPLVAMLYEHFYRGDRMRTDWTQKLARYGDLWLMDLAYVLFRIRFLGAFAPQAQKPTLTFYGTILSGIALVGQYAEKLLWPVHLCAYYVFHASSSLWDQRVLAGLLTLLTCSLLFAFLWKVERRASFAFVWMGATLAPVLDARLLAGNVFAERYLYLPSVGFAWLMGWAAVCLWRRLQGRGKAWRMVLAAAGSTVFVLAVVRVFTRNRIWRNDDVLYAATLEASPGATHIRNNLGVVYWSRGDSGDAEKEWLAALKTNPRDPIVLSNLGLVYANEGMSRKAESFFRCAMLRKPGYTDPHLNLGSLYAELGKQEKAELQFRAAAALSPLLPAARNRLGRFYMEEGSLDAAEIQFRASVRSAPNEDGYDGLADVLAEKGALSRAARAFLDALALNPYDSHAHFGVARIASSQGRAEVAFREYQLGLETDPHNLEALEAVKELRAREKNAQSAKP